MTISSLSTRTARHPETSTPSVESSAKETSNGYEADDEKSTSHQQNKAASQTAFTRLDSGYEADTESSFMQERMHKAFDNSDSRLDSAFADNGYDADSEPGPQDRASYKNLLSGLLRTTSNNSTTSGEATSASVQSNLSPAPSPLSRETSSNSDFADFGGAEAKHAFMVSDFRERFDGIFQDQQLQTELRDHNPGMISSTLSSLAEKYTTATGLASVAVPLGAGTAIDKGMKAWAAGETAGELHNLAKLDLVEHPVAKAMIETLAVQKEKEMVSNGATAGLSGLYSGLTFGLSDTLVDPIADRLGDALAPAAHNAIDAAAGFIGNHTGIPTDGISHAANAFVDESMGSVLETGVELAEKQGEQIGLQRAADPFLGKSPKEFLEQFRLDDNDPSSTLSEFKNSQALIAYLSPAANSDRLNNPETNKFETSRLELRQHLFGLRADNQPTRITTDQAKALSEHNATIQQNFESHAAAAGSDDESMPLLSPGQKLESYVGTDDIDAISALTASDRKAQPKDQWSQDFFRDYRGDSIFSHTDRVETAVRERLDELAGKNNT